MKMDTTLNEIRKHYPCKDGWEKLLKSKGKTKADDELFPITDVLDSNGLDDAIWCLRALKNADREIRLFACDIAERVIKFVPEGEDRPRNAIEVARRYANGKATDDELAAARDAAWAAARAADRDAARAAAWAAARVADRDAARAAASNAAEAALDAAWDAEREAIAELFIKWFKEEAND